MTIVVKKSEKNSNNGENEDFIKIKDLKIQLQY